MNGRKDHGSALKIYSYLFYFIIRSKSTEDLTHLRKAIKIFTGAQCLEELKGVQRGGRREKRNVLEAPEPQRGLPALCSIISQTTAANTTGASSPTAPKSHPTEEQFDNE